MRPGEQLIGQPIGRLPSLADAVALMKPNIMLMALLTAAGGMSLAPGAARPVTWLALMLGTALIVGAANTLNMYLERDLDCLMARTKNRPLPAGRMAPNFALVVGVIQAFIAAPILTFAINPLTGLLGVIALICYVMMYTPLKQRTTLATLIGSVPGAMPALMGWTAITGGIDVRGLAVFGVLFLWQMPHFHAIAMFRRKDYDRAGLKTVPGELGESAARWRIAIYLVAQVALSLVLYPLGVTGVVYLIVAILSGAAYLGYGLLGLATRGGPRWARRLFFASILYLPVLFTAMVFDGRL
ncbi:heme o synthase [Haliangium ochraceum]|uniref:Protoheme IX farnesyltransferase n=1 Tax=Haliangium ochraceum (strain DSM 14365 / JCM 11303 / SMP-2) TaxID=502025 RepID=D0LKA8_HALO1|nr:heme o synthase [Haliangium ochraceum]ACY13142.1 protoheme IX farnesyltransferase [Haliangium ochraceum DSM 14365]